jgi:hypothetical protein
MRSQVVAGFFLASAVACLLASLYAAAWGRRTPVGLPSQSLGVRFNLATGFHLVPARR